MAMVEQAAFVGRAQVRGAEHQSVATESGERPKSAVLTPGRARLLAGRYSSDRGNPLAREELASKGLPFKYAAELSLASRSSESGTYDAWKEGVRSVARQAQLDGAPHEGVAALRAVGLLDQDSPAGATITDEKLDTFFDNYLDKKANIEQFVQDIVKGATSIEQVKARVEAVPGLLISFGKIDSVDRLVGDLAIDQKAVADGVSDDLVAAVNAQLQEEVVDRKEKEYLAALAGLSSKPDEQPIDRTNPKGDPTDPVVDRTDRRVDHPTDPRADHTDPDHGADHHDTDPDSHKAKELWESAHGKGKLSDDVLAEASGLVSFESAKDGSAIAYVVDPDNHKVIRYFTGKPMPADEQARKAFIKQLREEIFDDPYVQKGIKRTRHQDVDIIRRKKYLWIKSSDTIGKFFNRARTYYQGTADGIDIAVYYQYSFPTDRQQAEREDATGKPIAVIMPGWSMGGMSPTATELAKYVADRTGRPALALDSIAWKQKRDKESLYREAHVIADMLQAEGLRKVSLVGHSQGARKALEVALVLQEKREAAQKALDSATTDEERRVASEQLAAIPEVVDIRPINIRGLTHQSILKLSRRFLYDSLIKTPRRAVRESVRRRKSDESKEDISNRRKMPLRALKAVRSISGGVYDKWWTFRRMLGGRFLAGPRTVIRTIQEVREMGDAKPGTKFRERMHKLKDVPIILTFGADDKVSDLAAVIPGYEKVPPAERSQYMSQHMHDHYFRGVPPEKITVKISETLGGLHGGPPVFAHKEVLEPPIEESVASSEDLAAVAAALYPETQPAGTEAVAAR